MADSVNSSRLTIHKMLNAIKKAEIENAKTMKFTDKDMVERIAKYILSEAKKELSASNDNDGEEGTLE